MVVGSRRTCVYRIVRVAAVVAATALYTVDVPTPIHSRTLTVVPPALRQLYLTPTTVIGGCGTSAGKILLTGAAPAGGAVVPLANTNSKGECSGKRHRSCRCNEQGVHGDNAGRHVAGDGNGHGRLWRVSQTLNPAVRPIRVQTLALSPNPARGGSRVTGTITLECPAAPGAVVVTVSSSNQPVARPLVTSVTIPAGGRTGSFAIQTTAVTAGTNVSIYAAVFGTRKTATLTVTP